MEITYHQATSNDIQDLINLRLQFSIEFSGEQPDEIIEALRVQLNKYLTKALVDQSCISFIAKADEKAVGIGSLHVREMPANFKNMSGKWGYIMNMYTVPEFRRKGICKQILHLLTNEGTRIGIGAFELHATQVGEMVYKNNGFTMHNEPTYRKYILKND